MSTFTKVWSDTQREAVQQAWFVAKIGNMAQIARLARAGELTFEGQPVPAFKVPDATVRDWINGEIRRRQGRDQTELARKPAEDAVEELRRRLVSLIDTDTLRLEKHARERRATPIDAEQIRKLARATRELAALPGPGEPSRHKAPGRDPNTPAGEAVRKPNSMSGQLATALAAPGINTPPETADTDAHTDPTLGEHPWDGEPENTTTDTDTTSNTHTATDTDDPGAYAHSALAGLRADGVEVVPG